MKAAKFTAREVRFANWLEIPWPPDPHLDEIGTGPSPSVQMCCVDPPCDEDTGSWKEGNTASVDSLEDR